MVLHTLNAAPTSTAFFECCDVAHPEDAILLLGDGVYAAVANSAALQTLRGTGASVYALQADMKAAGLEALDEIDAVDLAGFVALTERYQRQQAWY